MSTMKNFDDNELDMLLQQSASHKKAVEQINRQVMQTVQRDMRLKKVRKWVRLLGVCFGMPLATVCYIWALWHVIVDSSLQTPLCVICIALPLIALIVLFVPKLKNYRLDV